MPIWIVIVEWLARLILLGLLGLSVWSIAVIFERKKVFSLLDSDDSLLKESKTLLDKTDHSQYDRALIKPFNNKRVQLEKGLSLLGTLGSITPFIGLLGTILGIVVAFGELSLNSSSGGSGMNSVMFALAEALTLTALGLFVAIPAVVAFNVFKKKMSSYFAGVKSELNEYIAQKASKS